MRSPRSIVVRAIRELAVYIVLVISSSTVVQTNTALAAERPALVVTLTADSDLYRLDSFIITRVLLTNNSGQSIYIYSPLDWGESASISIWIKDKVSGAQVPESFVSDAVSPPPGSRESFVKLLPHHIYGVEFRSRLPDLGITKPGVYELTAEYHSPIPAEDNFGLPIVSREQGIYPSEKISVAVKK